MNNAETDDTLKNFYDQAYVEKFEKQQPLFRISRLMKHVHLPEDSDVADFGCGNGLLLTCLHDKVRTYSGIDFSEFFITAAKKRQRMLQVTNAEFFCDSIEAFCSRNIEKFDAGFAMDLAEHVPDDAWIRILTAIRKSLKPAGKLYIHTPNADFFIEKMKKRNFIFHQIEEHVAVRNVSRYIQMLEGAGYSEIDLKMLPHYNILRFIHVLSLTPYIGKYFEARIFIIAKK